MLIILLPIGIAVVVLCALAYGILKGAASQVEQADREPHPDPLPPPRTRVQQDLTSRLGRGSQMVGRPRRRG